MGGYSPCGVLSYASLIFLLFDSVLRLLCCLQPGRPRPHRAAVVRTASRVAPRTTTLLAGWMPSSSNCCSTTALPVAVGVAPLQRRPLESFATNAVSVPPRDQLACGESVVCVQTVVAGVARSRALGRGK